MSPPGLRFSVGLFLSMFWATMVFPWACQSETDRMKAPKEERRGHVTSAAEPKGSPLREAMRFFQTTISRVDGDRCPMYPTCSQYGQEALARHGAVIGLLMVVDRLFHEWSQTSMAPQVLVYGVRRFWDPVHENDFWFSNRERPTCPPGLVRGQH